MPDTLHNLRYARLVARLGAQIDELEAWSQSLLEWIEELGNERDALKTELARLRGDQP